jgi:arginyl-tRNA synthetase
MPDPQLVLAARVQAALGAAFGEDYSGEDPLIRPSQFADFQANVALSLAKRLDRKPRDVAGELVRKLDVADVCESVEISGPGFVNLTLRDAWIAAATDVMLADERLGVPRAGEPRRLVVDYSAPNIAKEMLAHHIRTTIVGDAFCRTAEFLGHQVIRQNHVGDWGTPFGMLIEHLIDVGEDSPEAERLKTAPNDFYQAARVKFDSDEAFAERSRQRVVRLQGGDEETLELWRELVELSKAYFERIYTRLGVTLTHDDLAGESMYNDMLADVCDELERKGIATMSEGALCVFLDGFTGRAGRPVPLIIRKSDGGYGYGTTDLAAIRYRALTLHADRIIYVIGAPQALHLKMVYETARKAGWLDDGAEPFHAAIGNVLGADGKMLRTRSGESVKLSELVDEAIERAEKVIADREYDDATRKEIAQAVGVGAMKYADLSVARDSEYVFDWDRMLALQGNTGPYLQYAVARIRSIFRRAGVAAAEQAGPAGGDAVGPIVIGDPAERALALRLLGFGSAIDALIVDVTPHKLCAYIYALADAFTTFYENCPVLRAPDEPTRLSRLALCAVTLRTLVTGLSLLGVPTPERL